MAKLRIYKANNEEMLELVRMQKQEQTANAEYEEERICLSGEMFRAEKKRLTEEQRYMERMNHNISYPDIKKILWFKNHIWGL